MSANANDYFLKVRQNFSTTIGSGGVGDGTTTTIPLTSVANLPTDTAIELVINRVTSAGVETNNYETVRGVVSGANLTNVVRGVEGTAQGWGAGVVVEYLVTADIQNRLVTGLLVEHGQDGVHSTATFDKLAANQTITGLKTFAQSAIFTSGFTVNQSAVFNSSVSFAGQPQFTGGMAVNQSAFFNSAIYTQQISPRLIQIQVFDPATAHATGDGKAFFWVPPELNGMNLIDVEAALAVVGTGSTTLTQLRRVRAGTAVDMLSTRLSIDAGEYDTTTAEAAAAINTSNDDVQTGDGIYVDHDQNHTTAGSGLVVYAKFALP